MAEGRRQEEVDYVIAFKSGNKLVAEQLLPRIPQPAAITTAFKFRYRRRLLASVSLLHLAAPIEEKINPLVAELFCHKLDLLEIVGFLCTFLQHAVC